MTIYDVAKLAECSPSTVSLVLSNDKRVNSETRKRVLHCMRELGYRPNYLARSLVKDKTNSIGVIVPDIKNPIFAEIISSIENYLSKHGYHVIIGSTGSSLENEKSYMYLLSGQRIDGLIYLPNNINSADDVIQFLKDERIPFVLAGVPISDNTINNVSTNMEEGGFLAVEHLVQKGHRNIAFFSGHTYPQQDEFRLSGYKKALFAFGLEYKPEYCLELTQDFAEIRKGSCAFFQAHPEVTAVFCLYDMLAMAALKGAMDAGRCIPRDCALVGFDNIALGGYLPLGLTTIDANIQQVGEISSRVLLKQIEEPQTAPQQIILTPRLIPRETS